MKIKDIKPTTVNVQGYLQTRFGDHFAQISVDTTLKLRSSVKDVSRVFHGRIPDIVESLTKRMQKPPQGISDYDFVFGYEESGERVPGSIESDAALQEYIKLYPQEWEIVQKCLGLARQKGRHACAYVIANRPVAEFIPLMNISGYKVTQYAAPSVEAAGGLKMDFLVINSLNDIQDAIKLIQARSGIKIPVETVVDGRRVPGIRLVPHDGMLHDIWDLPEDLAVFRDVAEGKTETAFQFNTTGAVRWLKHFNHWKNEAEGRKAVDSIEAMSAFTALDRPGPLNAYVEEGEERHNMLVEFARRARGEAPIGTLPIFQELLPETFGIMVYQEQLQKMYQALTGCSGPEAEEFRSNVAKKKMDKVGKAFGPWMERVGAKLGEANAKGIWDFFISWGQYGFNKSHSVCYSVIGYACAYLKHYFPLEWWCAVLRNADKKEINSSFWRHAGHMIDLPDISVSKEYFEIIGERLRAPTSMLQGVGPGAHEQLMKYAPYSSLEDFCLKQEKHCLDRAVQAIDKKTGQPKTKTVGRGKNKVEVPVMKRGHSALHRGVVYKLIVSGAMDSFFPKTRLVQVAEGAEPIEVEFDILDKLRGYEEMLAKVSGKRTPQPVKPEYENLGVFQRYQMRKAVLPAYSEVLVRKLVESGASPFVTTTVEADGRQKAWLQYDEGRIPFLSPRALDDLEHIDPFPEGHRLWAAQVGYVVAQRLFNYKSKHTGTIVDACELVIDVDGHHTQIVKWPNKEGDLDPTYKTNLEGAVVIIALSKWSQSRPFGLERLHIVQPPIEKKGDKEQSPEENEE